MPVIAIISDSHDNLATAKKAFSWLNRKKIKTMIHCGDVSSPAMLKEISKQFKGKIHLILGNIGPVGVNANEDPFGIETSGIKNAKFYGQTGELKIGGKKLAFAHEPAKAKELALTGKYDLVFYGHTHQPWEEKVGQCRLVNPGTLAGMFSKATFAIYDTEADKLDLKLVEKL
jgi:hypothetical protein